MERGRGLIYLFFTLLSRFPCFLSFLANHKKNRKKNCFHTMGLDLGYLTRKVCVFNFSRYFWFAVIAQGAQQRAYVAEKTRKKAFPHCFLIRRDHARCTAKSIRSQGRQQFETKTKKISNNKNNKIWEI